MSSKSPLHLAALEYAAQGIPVFPCISEEQTFAEPNPKRRKRPANSNGHDGATTDTAQIDAWWTENPNYNIAILPDEGGLAVIDLDVGADPTDLALPPTRTSQTPSGGLHKIYIGSIPPTVGKLGPKIDTRGQRSYIIVPPSRIAGKAYEWIDDRQPVALPDEVYARLAQADKQTVATEERLDLPANVATARTRLSNLASGGTVAISGSGGNDLTYRVVSELVRDLGISPALSLTLLQEVWNPACVPPWSENELKTIIENASSYGQNEPGAYASAPPQETFANANLASASAAAQPSRFKMLGSQEQDALPEPTWLLPGVIPENRIVLMSAQKGHFKTFLALDIALAISANVESFGVMPTGDGLVVYSAHESLEEIARLHRPAWFAVKGIAQGSDTGFYLTEGLHVSITAERDEFEKSLSELKARERRDIKLIVLDTYSASMLGFDENDPGDATQFILYLRYLIRTYGCSILIVAHQGKDAERGTRGTSALEYGVDTVIYVERLDNGMQVRVRIARHRGAPERKAPFHFEARPLAKSLVFHLLTSEERDALKQEHDPYSAGIVERHLANCNAVSDDRAISTRALAANMELQNKDESDERYEARIVETEQRLRRLARTSLRHLAFGQGAKIRWTLPPGEDADEELQKLLTP